MKLGVIYPQIEMKGDPEAVRRFGIAAEQLGYDHLIAYDHVLGAVHADREPKLTGPYKESDPFHEPLVTYAYLAGVTILSGAVQAGVGLSVIPLIAQHIPSFAGFLYSK